MGWTTTPTVGWIETIPAQCNDGIDNDGDDRIDRSDPGCTGDRDNHEMDQDDPACSDTIDNDEDGLVDWPEDTGCDAAGDPDEAILCAHATPVAEFIQESGSQMVTNRGDWNDYLLENPNRISHDSFGGEAVVVLTLLEPSSVTLGTRNADFDSKLYVRTICDDSRSEIASDYDPSDNLIRIRLPHLTPGHYFIFVDSSSLDTAGSTELVIQVEPL